jgi:DNA-binding GntR family transcriptional regulator
MSPGATFERVYLALKEQLGTARYAAGQSLEPAALSQDLNASITPVRDALHRLVGEGLVEAPRGDGFRAPLVTEVGLRYLYRWNGALLEVAVRSRHARRSPQPDASAAAHPVEATEELFLAIAAWTGNPEHGSAIARLNDRLRPIRWTEATLTAGFGDELDAIADLVRAGAPPLLRRSLAAYHRRRERLVGEIVAALVAPRTE